MCRKNVGTEVCAAINPSNSSLFYLKNIVLNVAGCCFQGMKFAGSPVCTSTDFISPRVDSLQQHHPSSHYHFAVFTSERQC
jgi:hypothetical protein